MTEAQKNALTKAGVDPEKVSALDPAMILVLIQLIAAILNRRSQAGPVSHCCPGLYDAIGHQLKAIGLTMDHIADMEAEHEATAGK